MADEHHREAETVLQLGEEVQHFGLNGHVKGGHSSSATMNRGWGANARAIAIRWR